MSTASIPVSPTLTREDGTAITLTDLSGVTGYLSVHGANAFAALGTLPDASTVSFVIPNITPGDYDFYATETDKQNPARVSKPSAIVSFNVPVPVVAAPSAPVVGVVTVS